MTTFHYRRHQTHKNNRITDYTYQHISQSFQHARRFKVDLASDGIAQVSTFNYIHNIANSKLTRYTFPMVSAIS
jgi:hypothetical protein